MSEQTPTVGETLPESTSTPNVSTTTEKPIIQSLITPLENMISACTTIEKTMDEMGIRALPRPSLTGAQARAPAQAKRVQISSEPPVLAPAAPPSRPPAPAAPASAPAAAPVPSSKYKTAVQSNPYKTGDKVIVTRSNGSETFATIASYDTNSQLYNVTIDGTTLTKQVVNKDIRPITNPPNSSEAYNSLTNTGTAVGSAFKNIGNLAGSTLGLTKDLTKAAISGTGAAFSGTGALFSKGSELLDGAENKGKEFKELGKELGKGIYNGIYNRITKKKAGGAKTHRVYKKDTKNKKK